VFEITCTHTIHYIDQLQKIVMEGSWGYFGGLNKRGTVYVLEKWENDYFQYNFC
jgi:hypothetical protein